MSSVELAKPVSRESVGEELAISCSKKILLKKKTL